MNRPILLVLPPERRPCKAATLWEQTIKRPWTWAETSLGVGGCVGRRTAGALATVGAHWTHAVRLCPPGAWNPSVADQSLSEALHRGVWWRVLLVGERVAESAGCLTQAPAPYGCLWSGDPFVSLPSPKWVNDSLLHPERVRMVESIADAVEMSLDPECDRHRCRCGQPRWPDWSCPRCRCE